jgi:hypothetical protein
MPRETDMAGKPGFDNSGIPVVEIIFSVSSECEQVSGAPRSEGRKAESDASVAKQGSNAHPHKSTARLIRAIALVETVSVILFIEV